LVSTIKFLRLRLIFWQSPSWASVAKRFELATIKGPLSQQTNKKINRKSLSEGRHSLGPKHLRVWSKKKMKHRNKIYYGTADFQMEPKPKGKK